MKSQSSWPRVYSGVCAIHHNWQKLALPPNPLSHATVVIPAPDTLQWFGSNLWELALRCFTTEEKRFKSIQDFAECHLVGDILPGGWSWAVATPRGSPQCASEGKMCILAITKIASSNPDCTWFILSKYPKVKYIFGASDQLQGSTWLLMVWSICSVLRNYLKIAWFILK